MPVQALDPLHAVAFAEDHVSVAAAPDLIVLGLAVSVIVGEGAVTDTVADCVAPTAGTRAG